jgi:hypothetical protein
MLLPLDGPSKSFVIAVTDAAVSEVKAGASVFEERKVITLQGDGKFYVYFADEGETPTTTDVSTKGFIQYKNAKESYEAAGSQAVYILADTGTVNVRGTERA